MKILTIDDEIQDLLPRLSTEESELLTASLLEEGCRHAIDVWERDGDLVLLDGHNRHAICAEHGIKYTVKRHKFASRAAALDWVLAQQLGKRNLTPEQYSYYRGKRYNVEKASISNNGGRNQHSEVGGQFVHQPKTAEKIAEETGVNEKTVRRDAAFAGAVDAVGEVLPEARQAILSGEVKASRKDAASLAKLPKAERKKAAKLIAAGKVESVGDALEAVAPEESSEPEAEATPEERRIAHNKEVEAWARSLNAACESCPVLDDSRRRTVESHIQAAQQTARADKGHAVCPKCDGDGCKWCHEIGWVSKNVLESIA